METFKIKIPIRLVTRALHVHWTILVLSSCSFQIHALVLTPWNLHTIWLSPISFCKETFTRGWGEDRGDDVREKPIWLQDKKEGGNRPNKNIKKKRRKVQTSKLMWRKDQESTNKEEKRWSEMRNTVMKKISRFSTIVGPCHGTKSRDDGSDV